MNYFCKNSYFMPTPSTKEKILSSSLRLFNEQGLERITTRDVAKDLGISQGNLHYHYPNKNELILALYDLFIDEVRQLQRYQGGEFSKEDMFISMTTNFELMARFEFLSRDREIIWRRLPQLKIYFLELLELKKTQIKEMIAAFERQGKLRSDLSPEQKDFLADQLIFMISSWQHVAALHKPSGKAYFHFAQSAFRIWFPYLEAQEMQCWEVFLGNQNN